MLDSIDLQIFSDEEEAAVEEVVEIPAELEGVSEDVAREVLSEVEVAVEDTEEHEEEEEVLQESKHGEADTETKGNVPYSRFKEVNDKYREAESQKADLERQLELLRSQQQRGPKTEPQPTPAEDMSVPAADAKMLNLLKEAHEVAKKQVLAALNITEDDYSDLTYQDEGEKAQIDRMIDFQYAAICEAARREADQMAWQRNQEQQTYAQAYQEYAAYAEAEQQRNDFEDIWGYATNERFANLPPYQQMVIQNAFNAVNNNQGTLEQIQIVRDYYDVAKSEYLIQNSGKGKKMKQMANSPRVDKVRGTPSTGGLTIAEMARMMDTQDWENIDPEVREQLLQGRLR